MRRIKSMEYYIGTREERLGEIPELQPGHKFFETDTGRQYWHTGSEWVEEKVNTPIEGRGFAANRPEASMVPVGFVYWSIDTGKIEVCMGSEWKNIGEV